MDTWVFLIVYDLAIPIILGIFRRIAWRNVPCWDLLFSWNRLAFLSHLLAQLKVLRDGDSLGLWDWVRLGFLIFHSVILLASTGLWEPLFTSCFGWTPQEWHTKPRTMSQEDLYGVLGKIMRTGPTLVTGRMKAAAGDCWPISGITWACGEWRQFEYSTWRNRTVKLKQTQNRILEIEKHFLESEGESEDDSSDDDDHGDDERKKHFVFEELVTQLKEWKFEVLRIKVLIEPENESTKKEYEGWHNMEKTLWRDFGSRWTRQRGQGKSVFLEEMITYPSLLSEYSPANMVGSLQIPCIAKSEKAIWPYSNDR